MSDRTHFASASPDVISGRPQGSSADKGDYRLCLAKNAFVGATWSNRSGPNFTLNLSSKWEVRLCDLMLESCAKGRPTKYRKSPMVEVLNVC